MALSFIIRASILQVISSRAPAAQYLASRLAPFWESKDVADGCVKVSGLIQRLNTEGLTQESMYIFTGDGKWFDMSFTIRVTVLS